MNIEDRIKNLEKSPVYAMSLGSKELFHSNFWAWLMRTNPDFIETFFPDFESKTPRVEREEKHRDITVHTEKGSKKDKIYIIENKIKSLPYVEQLAKYQIEAGDAFAGGIIAALCPPNFDVSRKYEVSIQKQPMKVEIEKKDNNIYNILIDKKDYGATWKFISYSEIVDGIDKLYIEYIDDPLNSYVVNEYVKITKEIENIINSKIRESEKKFSLECSELHDLKDIYKKYKMTHFKEYLKKFLAKYSGLNFVQDYSHDANLSIFYERKSDSGVRKRVGIQIEGSQYRRYAEFLGKKRTVDFEKYKEKKWFVDKENGYLNYGQNIKRPTGMRQDYCQYNNDIFVYQYWKIDDEADYDVLVRVIEDDMKMAENLIKMDI